MPPVARTGKGRTATKSSSYRQSLLDNGIRVVTEATDAQVVSVGIWLELGARDEQAINNGYSHFVEHLLFKGTKKRSPSQIARQLDVLGGHSNAFTSNEHTCYYATVLAESLPRLAELFADLLLNSCFAPDEIAREQEVILQEIAMVEDCPDDLAHELFNSQLWGGHPLANTILGSPEVISQSNAEGLKQFFRHNYRPSRMLISGAGAVDHDSFVRLWNRLLGSLAEPGAGQNQDSGKKEGQYARLAPRQKPNPTAAGWREYPRQLEQTHLVLGTSAIAEGDPRRYALQLLNTILGGNMSSRLFQEIREKRGLAYSVFSHTNQYCDSGAISVYLGVEPRSAEKALSLVRKITAGLARKGVSKKALNETRNYARAVLMLAEDNTEFRMHRLARNLMVFKREVPLAEVLEAIAKVSCDELGVLAAELFDRPLSGIALGPIKSKKLERVVLS